MYFGGRDRKIYCIDLRNFDIWVLICEEKVLVFKMEFDRLVDFFFVIWVVIIKFIVNKWILKGIYNFRVFGDYDNDCISFIIFFCI